MEATGSVKKWLLGSAGVLLAAVLVVLIARPAPVSVDEGTVSRGALERTLEEEGETRAMERYVLSAPVSAFVRRLHLDAGDRVSQGDTLAVLDPLASAALDPRARAQAQAQLSAAEAAIESARADMQAARASAEGAADEHQRLADLAADDAVSERELERAAAERRRFEALQRASEFRLAVAQAEREQAAALLEVGPGTGGYGLLDMFTSDPHGSTAASGVKAEAKEAPGKSDKKPHGPAAGRLFMPAPVDGVILGRAFESARVVQPGEPILELANLDYIEVEVEVRSADAVRIEPGMPVRLERWGGDEPLKAQVRRIEPGGFEYISALGVEERRVRVIVDILSPREDWQGLGDGFRVNAVFILASAEDVLRVPVSALFRHEGEWAVFAIEQRRARLREVEIGERGVRFAEIKAGLGEGDRVVVHPPRELEDGSRVN
ncbi:HlyD family efflux transporter periplasmic adaptor subunit [Halorhodospira halochloris]|uniref:efflux RND transporter periplasmic adaptor subunit n=1 Tax=Halorhodospira halochloris TaxID=1052 RepID=UPI001EE9069A|nr:HlyD family efflux transporter periplasmic adaptor subunit [Halorhodospira halochloris]